jgi:uncharacterized membrane protein
MKRCGRGMKKSRKRIKGPTPRQVPSSPENAESEQLNSLDIRSRVETALEPVIGDSNPTKVAVVERVVSLVKAESFRGPLPHPTHFEAYERVCPGISGRLVGMAELAQKRQEDRLDSVINHEFADRKLGLILGWLALVCLIVSGVIVTVAGFEKVGIGLFCASVLGAVIKPFIDGRRDAESYDGDMEADEPPKKRPKK